MGLLSGIPLDSTKHYHHILWEGIGSKGLSIKGFIAPSLTILLDSESSIIPGFIIYSLGYQWAWLFNIIFNEGIIVPRSIISSGTLFNYSTLLSIQLLGIKGLGTRLSFLPKALSFSESLPSISILCSYSQCILPNIVLSNNMIGNSLNLGNSTISQLLFSAISTALLVSCR